MLFQKFLFLIFYALLEQVSIIIFLSILNTSESFFIVLVRTMSPADKT